ncbi:Exosome complex component rrp4 [Astathelohania contejeani]|uniref:Exosome complex component rrp4 n=1 Tax=Astathelohania contejeani TaxID=164912 RepID=A0ABQ7I2A0_9MICR|nr:Exosome complex component rrp4 [Thelohania contejeani]
MLDRIYIPGEKIMDSEGYVRGHGTYENNREYISTTYGKLEIINKLISVRPLHNLRYHPEIGDVIVGRITGIANKKWKVKINTITDTTLQLSSINLPGGIQRRKLESDEMRMREYFDLNDVLVAEVQKVNKNGMVSLHTRNDKYGKLKNGMLIEVPSHLVRHYPTHFLHNGAVLIILGINGYIWLATENKEEYIKMFRIANYIKESVKLMRIIDSNYLLTF